MPYGGNLPKAIPFTTTERLSTPNFGEMLAVGSRKKYGKSAGYGFASFGVSFYGDCAFGSGIYQKRVNGYNQYTGPPGRRAGSYYVQMRTYRPTNPQTEAQQENRGTFAEAVGEWQGLTNEQKANYNKKASRFSRTGYNYYISEYMKNN